MLETAIKEEYNIRRIDGWSIKIKEEKIYGYFVPFGINYQMYLSGKIISVIDRHVMVSIDNKLYAFVLGSIDPSKSCHLPAYQNYLKQKKFHPHIII